MAHIWPSSVDDAGGLSAALEDLGVVVDATAVPCECEDTHNLMAESWQSSNADGWP